MILFNLDTILRITHENQRPCGNNAPKGPARAHTKKKTGVASLFPKFRLFPVQMEQIS